MARDSCGAFTSSATDKRTLAEELAIAQTTITIAKLLEETETLQRDLAKRLGVSSARVSQLLRAETNLTIRTMARIGHVLGRPYVSVFKQPATDDQ